jgi:hypothetical protein
VELLEPGFQNRFKNLLTNIKEMEKNTKTFENSAMGIWREVERGVVAFKVHNTRS